MHQIQENTYVYAPPFARYEQFRRREAIALEQLLIKEFAFETTSSSHLNNVDQQHLEDVDDDSHNQPEEKAIKQVSVGASARDAVLKYCNQEAPINFTKCCTLSVHSNCRKIGEGVYGEVFLFKNARGKPAVLKVMPIEGLMLVNGEHQKKYDEILTEMIIALELSKLSENDVNMTTGFNQVQAIKCVQGKYPTQLIDCWDIYNEANGSDNDNPSLYDGRQLYVVFELEYAGTDLEAFIFTGFMQVYNLFLQVALTLAVAEEELEFEHRDLHWGNVLIKKVDRDEKCLFVLNGDNIILPTNGVRGTIIDFTMSRISHKGTSHYNDLAQDPDLFTAEGDHQFDIYREMQKNNSNDWEKFSPYSNVLWLHYLLVKMTTAVNFQSKRVTSKDRLMLKTLLLWEQTVLEYSSVKTFVRDVILPKIKMDRHTLKMSRL